MGPGEQRVEISDNVIERCGQWKFVTVNLSQSVFGLNEDGGWALRAKCRLADAFGAVQHKAWGKRLFAALDCLKKSHWIDPFPVSD
jgi:hypothetical protein